MNNAPDWTRYAIGWHVYPLGFTGAPIHNPSDAPGSNDAGTPAEARILKLIPWLDYVQQLGLSVIQLAPVFESSTHGYDTKDYFAVDSRLGGEADVVKLFEAAHERGIKVLLDGVFNHIGAESPLYQQAVADENSEAAALFAINRDAEGAASTPCFEGHEGLIEFDHSSPATEDFVVEVMNYWLERGADGWRLDAAYAVDPEFWARVLPRVRERFPHAFIYGEVIHGDYPEIVKTATVDSVTEYELWKAIWSSLKEDNFYELEWTLKRHNEFLKTFVPVTFVGNHDVTRIATQVGPGKAALAAVVLFTVGGVPLVYYGDEQGYTGVKEERFGGDDEIRPPMPDSPSDLSDLGLWLKRVYQQLIALRRRHPWLHSARVEVTSIANEAMTYRVVATDQDLVDGADSLEVELSIESGQAIASIREGNVTLFSFPQ